MFDNWRLDSIVFVLRLLLHIPKLKYFTYGAVQELQHAKPGSSLRQRRFAYSIAEKLQLDVEKTFCLDRCEWCGYTIYPDWPHDFCNNELDRAISERVVTKWDEHEICECGHPRHAHQDEWGGCLLHFCECQEFGHSTDGDELAFLLDELIEENRAEEIQYQIDQMWKQWEAEKAAEDVEFRDEFPDYQDGYGEYDVFDDIDPEEDEQDTFTQV